MRLTANIVACWIFVISFFSSSVFAGDAIYKDENGVWRNHSSNSSSSNGDLYKDKDGVWRNHSSSTLSLGELGENIRSKTSEFYPTYHDGMMEYFGWDEQLRQLKMKTNTSENLQRIREIEAMKERPLGNLDSYESVEIKREGEK